MVRQLTAIMFTDMAGYTAMMQQDEDRAKESRDRLRGILGEAIDRHGGRVLQHYGDGSLSVFASAISAVRCAMEAQRAFEADTDIRVRIGIHTGDVVHDDDGAFGDGVNVASRIQALSVPGGILISGKVFDEVKNHPEIHTRSLGAFHLKHVKHPMKVFAITNDGLAVPSEGDVASGRVSEAKSVAVLPMVNMSADPENEYFSDGVTEDIINALTQVNGLKVSARTSSFAFKNRNEDIRSIAQRLAVTHVLEGSVRRVRDRVRVTVQLISASDGYHLFSESYDRSLEDIFGVQEEIARTVVERLARHLGPVPTSEERAVVVRHSHDTEAHAEYLRGRFEWARFSPEGARSSIRHFERAIEMDPDCALPHSGIASAYLFLGAIGQMPAEDAFPRAERAALRALELGPEAGESHVALGAVKLFHHWDFEGAYRSFQKALSLVPGSAGAHHLYAEYLFAIGEMDDAAEETLTATQIDPLSSLYHDSHAQKLLAAGRIPEAREAAKRAIELDPHFRSATETLGWIHVASGELEHALSVFEQLAHLAGYEAAGASNRGFVYGKMGRVEDAQRMLDLLEARAAKNPELNLDVDLAMVHEALGERDEAMAYLERAADRRMGLIVMLRSFRSFQEAHSHPRFQALLDRIGIPQPVAV